MTTTTRDPLIDEKATETATPIEVMLRLVSCAQLYRGADGRPYARVPVRDRHEFYELRSSAFRNWLVEVPRMADFAYWGEAIGRGLGWPEQSFRSAYARNRRGATIDTLENSAVADALFESAPSRTRWIGTCADLHHHLTSHVGKKVATSTRWPKTIARFSSELRRLSPHLRERGLSITFSRNRTQSLIGLTFDKGSLTRFPRLNHRPE